MHAIRTEDNDCQHDAAHWLIQNAKPLRNNRWSESILTNGKSLVQIPKETQYFIDLECTEEEEVKLMTFADGYTSRGASPMWRVHRWWLACFSSILGNTKDRNDV